MAIRTSLVLSAVAGLSMGLAGCGGRVGLDSEADAAFVSPGSGDGGLTGADADGGKPGAHDASVADTSTADARPDDASVDVAQPTTCVSPCTLYTGKGVGFPTGIAVDSTRVYIAENAGGQLLALPLGGGTAAIVATDKRPVRVAVDATALYWTSQTGSVKSVSLSGGAPNTIFATTGETDGIALGASSVYWTVVGQGGSVLSAPLGGGAATTIATSQDDPLYLAVTSTAAYWIDGDIYGSMDGGCLMTAPLDGGPPAALSPWQNLAGGAVAVDATNVYWAQETSIFSRPLGGGATTTLVSGVGPTDIAVDASHVYWTERSTNSINKVPITGGAATVVAKSFQLPMYLAVDATSVYWTDFADLVMKAAK
jgi:hypothetical protein